MFGLFGQRRHGVDGCRLGFQVLWDYENCGRNWLGLSGGNVVIKVGIVKRNAKRNGRDGCQIRGWPGSGKAYKVLMSFCLAGLSIVRGATPGQLQGNYLMQHDETTASLNDSQQESSGKN